MCINICHTIVLVARKIHISDSTKIMLERHGGFLTRCRGVVAMKVEQILYLYIT